ncbi:endonuclease domain-containing 1 protein [Stigmatopora argus]
MEREPEMGTFTSLCTLLSLLFFVHADIVEQFEDVPECLKYFYKSKVPKWGASTPGTKHLCQRFANRYHFATLYDTNHRIAVYSAYVFEPSNGGGREKRWFVEPQLVDKSWQGEMVDGYRLGKDHPGIYLGQKQALNEDYTHSGFDRGHLNPNGHHAVPGRNSTFTLTNVVPQNPKLNQNAWRIHESQLTDLFREKCSKAYVLVGAVPSVDNWIVKNNVKRVNIPEYVWNAYCCVDNNDRPIQSGAATAKNTDDNLVKKLSLDAFGKFLQQFSDQAVGEVFHNNCNH